MEEKEIKYLCDKYNIHPSKKLGQNFLVDPRILRIILDSADLKADDCVVEVGPGLGVLTQALAERVNKIISVELDSKLYQAAKEILSDCSNVELVQGDILKIPNSKFLIPNSSYKVVANLPYSITSAVLRKFTEPSPSLRDGTPSLSDGRPSLVVVMVQKEVAERVCAGPGEMSILSVAVQYYAKPEIVKIVPRSAFWPEPEVDSAILRIAPRIATDVYGLPRIDEKRLFQLVRMGFSSRRKQLQNNLMAGLRIPREQVVQALEAVGLESKVRAQDLSVTQWIELARNFVTKRRNAVS